ncbi:MAG TPA: restriction endonuclease subunit S, partial [Coriobacteriia bacterium]|nr:restriction endonuclease subunit S [Coriobacteriia bacterium]
MEGDWATMTLGSLCTRVTSGGTPRTSEPEYYGGGIPWVTTGEVNYGKIKSTSRTLTEVGVAGSSAKIVPTDTVIVAMYGRGTAGRVAMAGVPLTTNQACCNLVINPTVADPRFVYYALTK